MVRFAASETVAHEVDADLLVCTATRQGEGDDARVIPGAGADAIASALGLDVTSELRGLDMDGSVGAVARIPTGGRLSARSLLIVGLGNDVTADAVRTAGAAVASAASRTTHVAIALPDGLDDAAAAQAMAEGLRLGGYRFGTYKSDGEPFSVETVTLVGSDAAAVASGAASGETTADAACLARDLVNLPPNAKRPGALADRVLQEIAGTGIEARVMGPDELEAGGYGGLLGVCAGSSDGPRLVELTYAPAGAGRHIALVGKGITFDSGGLSLKPSASMETMKLDMGGAAAVVATMRGAAALELPLRITGLLALAENMPSGTAIRPGDVLTIKDGTTVEVLNTDAEGRLVLADALVHACELGPDVVVDVATLTGAAEIALGERIGVLMADDDGLADALLAAGDRAGEPFWRLPVAADQYREKLDSDVADMKNTGGRKASTITAGLFLHHFVRDGIPWAHLDIAGVAWSDEEKGYRKKGGTGVPARLLLEWLRAG